MLDVEEAIVVNPPQEIETNEEVQTSTRNAGQSQESPIVLNEAKRQLTYTFTRSDIKAIAKEEVQEELERGAFDDIVEANPTLAGTESNLTGLKVGDTNYKVEQPINVEANPSSGSASAELTKLKVGNSQYSIGDSLGYLTSAPSSANTSGRLIFVVLSSEPATKYDGYFYIITEA